MSLLLRPDDENGIEPGRPIPYGRVYQKGEYYLLKPLNPNWANKAEYVHMEKVEIFIISEVSGAWLKRRWAEMAT
ncbi:MAG: hypothetical protein HOC71_09315 [Candidatus Latescibacteria bacterium]|jgi:hypothetical protein|nr:hypothetical protein [Candidatus Latescibacterota bacterium]